MLNRSWKITSRLYRREALWSYIFITPFLTGLGVFYIYAFFNNIYISFTNKKTFGLYRFIGFENFVKLFGDSRFLTSLGNTVKYVLFCVPAVIIFSILLACLLNSKIKLNGLYRTLIFIPAVTMPAAIGLVWRWMMNYEFGLINGLLGFFGVPPLAWLSDPNLSLFAVSIVLVWADVSTKMVILLAGLQGIPRNYYEAATIDGAGVIPRFFHITIPLLSPMIFFCLIMESIGVFQIFDFIYLMIPRLSSGMPGARSVIWLFYDEAFSRSNQGYAAAVTVILFFIILFITIIQMTVRRRWVYEE
ncbi:MAG: sugar ABC transporter permease [Spirochaetaceae bacterium]|jgi:multiple sugar transport system permease protein|nr:sugar ABC transporter permease [Spirochaetaceae bacterium]